MCLLAYLNRMYRSLAVRRPLLSIPCLYPGLSILVAMSLKTPLDNSVGDLLDLPWTELFSLSFQCQLWPHNAPFISLGKFWWPAFVVVPFVEGHFFQRFFCMPLDGFLCVAVAISFDQLIYIFILFHLLFFFPFRKRRAKGFQRYRADLIWTLARLLTEPMGEIIKLKYSAHSLIRMLFNSNFSLFQTISQDPWAW